ncbi:MAG: polysaccharide deacetylase family protein [Sphingomonas sp.]
MAIAASDHQRGSTSPANRLATLRRKICGPITEVRTSAPVVALTFDDGPDPVYTPQLLEVLRRRRAKATFFMVGSAAQAHPEIVSAVAEAGHAIGNHSYSHCDFLEVPPRRRIAEIRACARSLGGHETKIFRPPYGRENLASHLAARSLGYSVVKWSISTGDWRGVTSTEIADLILRQLRPGAIILLHDSIARDPGADRSATIDAVDRLLDATEGAYTYLTIPELFAHGRAG